MKQLKNQFQLLAKTGVRTLIIFCFEMIHFELVQLLACFTSDVKFRGMRDKTLRAKYMSNKCVIHYCAAASYKTKQQTGVQVLIGRNITINSTAPAKEQINLDWLTCKSKPNIVQHNI